MAKPFDDTNCPKCNEQAVYLTATVPDPAEVVAGVHAPRNIAFRKVWLCSKCDWEDENSAPREPYKE
jgi:ribosomal protein L37AE/L43A